MRVNSATGTSGNGRLCVRAGEKCNQREVCRSDCVTRYRPRFIDCPLTTPPSVVAAVAVVPPPPCIEERIIQRVRCGGKEEGVQ